MNPPTARRLPRLARLATFLSASALSLAAAAQTPPPGQLPTVQLSAGMHLIKAELAASDPARARGLMFREFLPPNGGMLFLFDEKSRQCMWMRNTLIPLSVAFVADDGSILNIEDMEPRTEISHCSSGPARYALEMSRGWFAAKGIKPGMKIGGIPAPR